MTAPAPEKTADTESVSVGRSNTRFRFGSQSSQMPPEPRIDRNCSTRLFQRDRSREGRFCLISQLCKQALKIEVSSNLYRARQFAPKSMQSLRNLQTGRSGGCCCSAKSSIVG